MASRPSHTSKEAARIQSALRPANKKDIPLGADSDEVRKAIHSVIRGKQVLTREFQGKEEVSRTLETSKPFQVFLVSDLHFGHASVDYKALDQQLQNILKTPNAYVIFMGDLIEGFKAEYANTNTSHLALDFTQQTHIFRERYLKPLAEAGKVLALITGYNGHEGWSEIKTTYEVAHAMVAGLDIPLLQNGGFLRLKTGLGEELLQLFHSPPQGSNKGNVLGGLRNLANTYPQNSTKRPKVLGAGHIHQKAYSIELPVNGGGQATILTSNGTWKGTADIADPHYIRSMPGRKPQPGSISITFYPRNKRWGKQPTALPRDERTLRAAAELYNHTEHLGNTAEVVADIRKALEAKGPVLAFDRKNSRLDESPFDEQSTLTDDQIISPAKQWRELSYRVQTQLPMVLWFIANARIGSSGAELSRNRKALMDTYRDITMNPQAVVLFLRNMLNDDTPNRSDRQAIVNRMLKPMMSLGEQHKVLGFMLSGGSKNGGMKSEAWKKTVGDSPPFMAGTYIADKLGTHLFNNLSMVNLALGTDPRKSSARYSILTADKLNNSGSSIHTFNGLQTVSDANNRGQDITVGGHMPRAGVMARHRDHTDTGLEHLIAPGWYSKVDTLSKGNQQDGSAGGQAVILMPNEKMIFPAADRDAANELFTMLTLLRGLALLPELKNKLSGKSTR